MGCNEQPQHLSDLKVYFLFTLHNNLGSPGVILMAGPGLMRKQLSGMFLVTASEKESKVSCIGH